MNEAHRAAFSALAQSNFLLSEGTLGNYKLNLIKKKRFQALSNEEVPIYNEPASLPVRCEPNVGMSCVVLPRCLNKVDLQFRLQNSKNVCVQKSS
jgi:hypothetical protein